MAALAPLPYWVPISGSIETVFLFASFKRSSEAICFLQLDSCVPSHQTAEMGEDEINWWVTCTKQGEKGSETLSSTEGSENAGPSWIIQLMLHDFLCKVPLLTLTPKP